MNIWYITIIGIILAIYGTLLLINTATKATGKFKKSLTLLWIAGLFGPGEHLVIAVFGMIGLDITNPLWNIIPIFFTLAMIFLTLSMKSLIDLFKELKTMR